MEVTIRIFKEAFTIAFKYYGKGLPSLLHPGSAGEYVVARSISLDMATVYSSKGWDIDALQYISNQFLEWEKTGTTSVEDLYRRAGLRSMATRVKKEASRVDENKKWMEEKINKGEQERKRVEREEQDFQADQAVDVAQLMMCQGRDTGCYDVCVFAGVMVEVVVVVVRRWL
ncbi:hypothetical protein G6011_06776 [Alternaria panax]|uniref:Uncharacterized protein n=1 Tax=Alternaria panax TaxID=48097 RepID=A0AAD4FH51_9PLEO|nr:hypothetical protein G6011_06776 [Alternaria panax]